MSPCNSLKFSRFGPDHRVNLQLPVAEIDVRKTTQTVSISVSGGPKSDLSCSAAVVLPLCLKLSHHCCRVVGFVALSEAW